MKTISKLMKSKVISSTFSKMLLEKIYHSKQGWGTYIYYLGPHKSWINAGGLQITIDFIL